MGRDEKQAPLKMPAWEAAMFQSLQCLCLSCYGWGIEYFPGHQKKLMQVLASLVEL